MLLSIYIEAEKSDLQAARIVPCNALIGDLATSLFPAFHTKDMMKEKTVRGSRIKCHVAPPGEVMASVVAAAQKHFPPGII